MSSSPIPRRLVRPVGIMTLAQFINNLGFGCAIPVLPVFSVEMGLGASGVGMFLATSALGRMVCNMPFGALADRIGRKPLMIGGTLTTSMASFATAASPGPVPLLCSRFLLGCGGSASMAGGQAYMADITAQAPQHRGKILGYQSTIVNLSYAAGPAIGGLLCDLHGARMCFGIMGMASATAAMTLTFLNESKPPAAITPLHAALPTPDQGDKEQKQSYWEMYGPLLRNPDQQGLMVMQFAVFCSYAALMTVFPLHAVELLNASASGAHSTSTAEVGALFGLGALVGFAGAPLGGWLADRIGRKMTVHPAACLTASGMLLCTLPHGVVAPALESVMSGPSQHTMLVVAILVWGLGNSMCTPGLSAFAADIAHQESRGKALSLSRQASDFALLTGPLTFGSVAHMFGTSAAMWTAAAVVTSANVFFGLRSKERKVRPDAEIKTKNDDQDANDVK